MEIIMLAAVVALYFLPGLIAYMSDHQNSLNLSLGWTMIGWMGLRTNLVRIG